MGETYCGKSCDNCSYKEALKCPGCKAGPGKEYSRECKIAMCCRERKYESCDSCNGKADCLSLRNRFEYPKIRKDKLEEDERKKRELDGRAKAVGKWIWILFWLIVPNLIAEVLTTDLFATRAPGVYKFGLILSAVVSLVYGVILLKLSDAEEMYKKAGIFCLISVAGTTLNLFLGSWPEGAAVRLFISIAIAIVSIVAVYYEFMAHRRVLEGIDYELADSWDLLWKLYLGATAALVCSLLFMFFAPVLGVIIMIAALIAMLVASINKLINLYRTAIIFKDYRAEDIGR